MFASSLALATLAVTANAFLVPLTSDNLANNDFAITSAAQSIDLDCSTCPYALSSERNGQHEWTNDVANDLEMNFNVVDNTLTFNGARIYPLPASSLPPVLTVAQKVKPGVETDMQGVDHQLRLSYSLTMGQKAFDDGNTLVIITVSPMALDGEMIRVDDVEVKAITDSAGTITLHSLTTITPDANSPDAHCTNVMCRVMAKLVTTLTTLKTTAKTTAHKLKCLCAKCFRCVMHKLAHAAHHHDQNHHGVPQLNADGTITLPTHHHFKPQDARPHHWQHHGVVARVAHVLWATVRIAVIPILIGIAFGMAASAIGMLVGQLVVFVWIRYRRTDGVVYEELPTDDKEIPPPYEDVPVVRVVDEKGDMTEA